jgi:hypothetical protein
MWTLESWRAKGLLALLDRAPANRWDLDEFFDEQGWDVIHDSAQPTGYLAVDPGWGFKDGRGLLLYVDDSELAMFTGLLGPWKADNLRGELMPALWTVSQRYGTPGSAGGASGVWDVGTGTLHIAPEEEVVTATWVKRGYLGDSAAMRSAGLSMRVLEKMVNNAATDPDWADAVARATQLVPRDEPIRDQWELTASVAVAVNLFAKDRGIPPSQVRHEDIAEPLAAAIAAASQPPGRDHPH